MVSLKQQRLSHCLPRQTLSFLLVWLVAFPGGAWQPLSARTPAAPATPALPRPFVVGNSSETNADPPVHPADPGVPDPPPATHWSCEQPSNVPTNPSPRNPNADAWGEITVAQPKIWQFERVSALLDGLLRDVEGVSLADLTQLDPNAQNAAALQFLQTALEVGVQYDRAAAVNNKNILANYQAINRSQLQQLDAYNNYMKTLTAERDRLASQLVPATNEANSLKPLDDAGSITSAQKLQLTAAQSRVTALQNSLDYVNGQITNAGAPPALTAPPAVTGTAVQAPASGAETSSTLSGFADVLKNLPQGLTDNLNAALKSPSYPASKRLDNFITLLYERLAREVSVLQDDLTRDPENLAFLLQFDVGLYPSKKAKDHVARVEFNLDCPGCKIYSLYPGQSSYNVANYSGASKRTTLWGNVLTLIGFGFSASYRRQQDTLRGSLVQSVYTAGFQNGMLDDPNPTDRANFDGATAEQSFGWYYGPATFEQLVTQGIHTTFALVTVPRRIVADTRDSFGNANACLPVHINGVWTNRNDPLRQDSYFSVVRGIAYGVQPLFYLPTGHPVFTDSESEYARENSQFHASVMTKRTTIPLPASLEDYSLIASREKQKLHVLRLEYNTVYESQAPTVTGTLATPASAPASGAASGTTTSSASLDPLPCPKGKCAAMLIRLDRSIDPNLVVTVGGKLLQRVRDWRGRATSAMPPAQSGSDQPAQPQPPAPASGAGTIPAMAGPASTPARALAPSRGLLETDLIQANSWYPVNSSEMLLNISVDVATDTDFPVIQITDPSRSIVIPYDLRRNITELIVNGFRLKPITEQGIQKATRLANWTLRQSEDNPLPSADDDAPISLGLFPYSTFPPLFLPDPGPRNIYAHVGETGEELLIGFLPGLASCGHSPAKAQCETWLETRTQVILEDRDLDFAWSLSCYVQGADLVCPFPKQEISRAYFNYVKACPSENDCPAQASKIAPLRASADKAWAILAQLDADAATAKKDAETKADAAQMAMKLAAGNAVAQIQADTQAKDAATAMNVAKQKAAAAAAAHSKYRDFRFLEAAFVSTMVLWVEQWDPDGNYLFYSPEPARIDFLPLSSDYSGSDSFKSWGFLSAGSDYITIEGCNYFVDDQFPEAGIKLLGASLKKDEQLGFNKAERPCVSFDVSTAEMTRPQLILQVDFGVEVPRADRTSSELRTIMAVPTARLLPRFGAPVIRAQLPAAQLVDGSPNNSPAFRAAGWTIELPVSRTMCTDSVDVLPELASAGFRVQWRDGSAPLIPCDAATGKDPENKTFKSWKNSDDAGRLQMYLEIPRAALQYLPNSLRLVRTTSGGVKIDVATLPNLRKLLLPSKLTLASLSDHQFTLRGDNAAVIDAVALQDGKTGQIIPAASGVDFTLVTVPVKSAGNGGTDTSTGGSSETSSKTTIVTSNNSARVEMSTANKNTASKPNPAPKPGAAPPDKPKTPPDTSLAPGTYTVVPLLDLSPPAPPAPAASAPAAVKPPADAKAKPGAADKDKAGAADHGKTPAPNYFPLEVTDSQGNPLLFTIPDAKKKDTTSQAAATTIAPCAVPCLLSACSANCVPAPNPTPAPKSP